MIGGCSHIDTEYMECLAEKKAKGELIPKIVDILQRFKCEQCAFCCINAGIDLSPDEAVEIMRLKGKAYFDMIDTNAVRDRLKAPCGLLEGNQCSIYERRPMSCRVYPFAWVMRGMLVLFQCPMGREVTSDLLKFAEFNSFKVEKVEPEKRATAIGQDGKVIAAAIVPYILVREYYESLCIL